MNIAVFTDKFSGTLTAHEVIDVIKENFGNFNIEADFFVLLMEVKKVLKFLKAMVLKLNHSMKNLIVMVSIKI